MNNLIRIINNLDYKELKMIQKDIAEGNMGRLVADRINLFEQAQNYDKVCPTCDASINDRTARFTLIFGNHDFKKKASFCGHDCLIFFIEKLKTVKH